MTSSEEVRLSEDAARQKDWRLWGTYLPDRQWSTVREDYSPDGDPWESFPYDMSRLRAYRWGEDGLLGWTDREARLCFSVALWNGRDSHLKDKLFGLSNTQGNHGEDVKELYYHLDATPSGSYAKALYKYPQAAFPYEQLIAENARRGLEGLEYELLDTGVFADERYFDVLVEYAKFGPEDILIRVTISNRGPDAADMTALPTLIFRNDWAWTEPNGKQLPRPTIRDAADPARPGVVAEHPTLGRYRFATVGEAHGVAETLFTGNETNREALGYGRNDTPFCKDAFHRYVVDGDVRAVDPARQGTKVAFLSRMQLASGASHTLRARLVRHEDSVIPLLSDPEFDACFTQRIAEADAFYTARLPSTLSADERAVARQAYAGLLWTKQVYHYDVKRWLAGDPTQPPVSPNRATGRNADWQHLSAFDVISMPDKWEYPWFAAWDLAFHTIPFAEIDPAFAKAQLLLILSERYLHPNGAVPAYEYGFGDANPPVHAAAVWQVYEVDRRRTGEGDTVFLEHAFLRLMVHFTWWVNRHDPAGNDVFNGGFLGLDNIGLFDRNMALPDGMTLLQADATAWMGLFCSVMQMMAVELAQTRPVFQDMAVKFFHHFMLIVDAMNRLGSTGPDDSGLWDEETGFFYDRIVVEGGDPIPLKIQSIVGLVPLFAIAGLRRDHRDKVSAMMQAIEARIAANPDIERYLREAENPEGPFAGTRFVALVPKERMLRLLQRVLDETQFLSPYGIRSVSAAHQDHPFSVELRGKEFSLGYVPGEGNSRAFGGNSNWRGPIWFPINVLLIHALQRSHEVYGDAVTVECPAGSGQQMHLGDVARELAGRLVGLFLPDQHGRRPCHGEETRYAAAPHWRDLILFNEYFHADTGRGLGASHQTGWTGTVATCIALCHGPGPS